MTCALAIYSGGCTRACARDGDGRIVGACACASEAGQPHPRPYPSLTQKHIYLYMYI